MYDPDGTIFLNEWASLMRRQHPEPPPDKVYHYTSAGGLLGVLTKKQLWATHYQYLNDPSEMPNLGPKLSSLTERLMEPRLGRESEGLERQVRRELLDAAIGPGVQVFDAYAPLVVSFAVPSNSLTLWRLYGDDGLGYAIGFDSSKLSSWKSSAGLSVTFGPIIYDSETQDTILEAVFEIAVKHTLSFIVENQARDLESVDRGLGICSGGLVKMLASTAPFFKGLSYSDECEWRLVVDAVQPGMLVRSLNRSGTGVVLPLDDEPPDWKENLKEQIRRYRVRESVGEIVPYHELDLSPIKDGLIREVVAGPCVDSNRHKTTGLIELLVQLGNWKGPIDIEFSGIPYRRSRKR